MSDSNQFDSEQERAAAEDRLARIRGGSSQPSGGTSGAASGFDDFESEAISRARSRADATREALDRAAPAPRGRARGGRGRQGLIIIMSAVGIGGVVLVVILFVGLLGGGGGGFGLFATRTPTPTATPLATPTPPATPTETPTPTAPVLQLPNLECVFDTSTSCAEYCRSSDHQTECQAARDFLTQQGVSADAWFLCLEETPTDTFGCLEYAWYANQPWFQPEE